MSSTYKRSLTTPPLQPQQRRLLLQKQMSWSPDGHREEAWLRRRDNHRTTSSDVGKKSVTDDDLEELKACFELGFGFDSSSDVDHKLSDTFPALEFYYAVNKQYNNNLSRTCSSLSSCSSAESLVSESDAESACSIIEPGEEPEKVKTKLKHWAQVVACSVTQSASL